MNFKSNTELVEHVKELVKDGYLKEFWEIKHVQGGTAGRKYYSINFEAVKK
jgi:hypothetical protein